MSSGETVSRLHSLNTLRLAARSHRHFPPRDLLADQNLDQNPIEGSSLLTGSHIDTKPPFFTPRLPPILTDHFARKALLLEVKKRTAGPGLFTKKAIDPGRAANLPRYTEVKFRKAANLRRRAQHSCHFVTLSLMLREGPGCAVHPDAVHPAIRSCMK